MGYLVKKNIKVFLVKEDTEGTYKAASSPSETLMVLADGMEIKPSRETLERNILTGSIGVNSPRTGMKSVSATLPCEFRAGETTGAAPDYSLLLEGALGKVQTVAEVTSLTGHSASSINLSSADASGFVAGDIICVMDAGKYHVTPVEKVNAGSIDLLIHCATAPSDGVKIAAAKLYKVSDSGHPSLTIETWLEGVRKETAFGCKVSGMTLANFTTGKLADLSFKLDGMGFDQTIGTLGVSQDLQTSLPPIILSACVYQDGVAIPVNELTLSVENTLGFITSTCSANGKISSRVTTRTVKGTIDPYKSSTDVNNFTSFNANTPFSLFAFAKNPTAVTGEFGQIVAIYLPNCLATELAQKDKDQVLQETVSFSATRGADGSVDEIVIACI
jgi:hypothetical protein